MGHERGVPRRVCARRSWVEITVRRERGVSQRVANTVITRKVTVSLGARCVAAGQHTVITPPFWWTTVDEGFTTARVYN